MEEKESARNASEIDEIFIAIAEIVTFKVLQLEQHAGSR
jgi:hypothetical protein